MGFLQSCVREGTALREVSEVEDVTTNLKTLTVHTVSSCGLNSENLSRSPWAAHEAFLSACFWFFYYRGCRFLRSSESLCCSSQASLPWRHADRRANARRPGFRDSTPETSEPRTAQLRPPLHPASPDPYAPSPRAKTRAVWSLNITSAGRQRRRTRREEGEKEEGGEERDEGEEKKDGRGGVEIEAGAREEGEEKQSV